MTKVLLLVNVWWAVVIAVIAVFEYKLGKKEGRRVGYAEGWAHGREDAHRELAVPVKRLTEDVREAFFPEKKGLPS
jgi:hypothetical protein